MTKTGPPWLDPAIAAYVDARTAPPDDVLRDLIDETTELTGDRSRMQISPGQGTLLSMITSIAGARNAVEVGTFTGYSSICIARALAPGGRLLCLDVSDEYTAVARRYWERAGLSDRIDLQLGPAIDTLQAMDTEPTLDLAFIDADKPGYAGYWDEIVPRLRSPGGVALVDNTLWSGRVVSNDDDDNAGADSDTEVIRAFNDMVAADDRVVSTVLPIADGLTLAVRI